MQKAFFLCPSLPFRGLTRGVCFSAGRITPKALPVEAFKQQKNGTGDKAAPNSAASPDRLESSYDVGVLR